MSYSAPGASPTSSRDATAASAGPVMMFHDPTVREASMICYLLANVTKSNQNQTAEQLIQRTQDPEAFRFLIKKMAVDILSNPKDADPALLVLLNATVQRALQEVNYITLLADMLEGLPASINTDRVYDFIKSTCRLKPKEVFAVAVALNFSCTPEGESMGQAVLARQLNNYARNASELLGALGGQEDKELHQHVILLAGKNPNTRQFADMLRSARLMPVELPKPSKLDDVILGCLQSVSLAGLMEELGTPCCCTPEDFSALLDVYPGELTTKRIAECLVLFASANTPNSDPNYFRALLRSAGHPRGSAPIPTPQELQSWSTTSFVAVAREKVPSTQWADVICQLDYPSCQIDKFVTICSLYKKATGEALPVRLFMGHWDNAQVQATALRWILSNPTLVAPIQLTESDLLYALPYPQELNINWRSVGFVQSMIHATGVDKEVESCLMSAVEKAPINLFGALILCREVAPSQIIPYCLKILRNKGVMVITARLLEIIKAEGALSLLLGILSEFANDTVRGNEAMDCLSKLNLIHEAFKIARHPKVAAHIAIHGVATEILPKTWFTTALEAENKEWHFTKYAFVGAIVEVCDELLAQTPPQISEGTTQALTAVSTSQLAGVLSNTANYAKTLLKAGTAGDSNTGAEGTLSPEMEKDATDFLKKMYASDGMDSHLDKAVLLYSSPKQADKDLCQAVVHVLWEESRCVNEYPKKVLTIAAKLFGKFINAKDLLPQPRLQSGLRIVLQALMKPADGKVLEFGIQALEQFKFRVTEWPQYCNVLKSIPDLDMHVPGIMATINSAPNKNGKNAASPTGKEGGSASPAPQVHTAGSQGSGGMSSAGLHQHDIRILMGRGEIQAPPAAVQNRINFLVGNTDKTNMSTCAQELRDLLKPEYFPHFADYLVVKRVSLEANHHKMYHDLLDCIDSEDLHTHIRDASMEAIKRLLGSDKVRANNGGERTLLKNLGAWLGLITLARNIPILAKDLNFKELLYDGLKEGKLIAVVPLIAKVLEQAPKGRVFCPPNPWLMSQLGHLMELYLLPDLKLALRFEIEVLCKHINVQFNEIPDTARLYATPKSMLDIRRNLDTTNSSDWPPPQVGQSSPTPDGTDGSSRLRTEAAPFRPRDDQPNTMDPARDTTVPQPHTIVIDTETVKFGNEVNNLPAAVRNPYKQALPGVLQKVVSEMGNTMDRSVLLAATTTAQVVLKDFTRDPDDTRMRRAAHHMVRVLASSLCNVHTKDSSKPHLKKFLINFLPQYFEEANSQQIEVIAESISTDNIELVHNFISAETSDRASRKIEELLLPQIEERQKAIRANDFPVLPADQQTAATATLMSSLPEALRPSSLQRIHLSVYTDFSKDNEETAVEEVLLLLGQIEESARRHYGEPNPVPLSLTSTSFTESNHSEHHTTIKNKLLEVAQLITEKNALPLAQQIFPKLMKLAESLVLPTIQRNPLNSLLNEVCLFVLQSARERNQAKVVAELTTLYLGHERCWVVRDVAINFLRLRLMNITEFDTRLSTSLREEQAAGQTRSIVEFAGHVVQRCLIDDKLANPKEMKSTLNTLEEIARSRRPPPRENTNLSPAMRGARAIRIPTLHPAEHRTQVKPLFLEWMSICAQRAEMSSTPAPANGADGRATPQQLSMAFVTKLQGEGLLRPDGMLDRLLGVSVDFAVEEYCTKALHFQTQGAVDAAVANEGVQADGKVIQPTPFRYKSDAKVLFNAVDGLVDLVILLARCCGWNGGSKAQGEGGSTQARSGGQQADAALVTKVLHVATKVLQHNHDYFVAQQKPTPPQMSEGEALQEDFMQQPYVRLFSNLIISLNPPQTGDQSNGPPSEMMQIIASALHLINPQRVPGFAFGWLELIGHRVFVNRMLKNPAGWPAYCKVYCDALRFMEPFVRSTSPLSDTFLLFFKSVLKLSLVLLHDFPDFVMTYHQPLCDAIPGQCIQLRNVILSAFPRNTRLPDPFGTTFKLDQMPEVTHSPPLADSVRDYLSHGTVVAGQTPITKEEVQSYVRNPKSNPNFAETVANKLSVTKLDGKPGINVQLLNNVVLTMALLTLENLALDRNANPTETPAALFFRNLTTILDNEGRYLLFSAFANQLRYPNTHTHFFSAILLHLFDRQSANQEVVQEQITRVLIERVLITRPHPWGLLVTFIELVRNPRYNFWSKPFIRCSPSIDSTFEQVGRSLKSAPGGTGTVGGGPGVAGRPLGSIGAAQPVATSAPGPQAPQAPQAPQHADPHQ